MELAKRSLKKSIYVMSFCVNLRHI